MKHSLIGGLGLSTLLMTGCPSSGPTKGLTSDNHAPTVVILSPEYGSNYATETAVVFHAVVDDDVTPAGRLGVLWASSLDGDLEFGDVPNSEGEVSLTLTDLSVGGHTVEVTVMDEEGLETSASTLVNIVEEGEPPTIVLVYPAPGDQGISGEDMAFEAVVDDPDDSLTELNVVFTADEGEGDAEICIASSDEEGVSRCTSTLGEGVWDVTATVSDRLGQTATATTEDFEVLSPDAHDGDLDGFTEDEGDCDDENITVFPDAPELADELDNDCDGEVDEGTADVDDDDDGFTEDEGDCDDYDGTVYPGAVERPDGVDEDCDGEIDDGTIAYDDDGDCYCEGGAGVEECVDTVAEYCPDDGLLTGDCDDDDEDIHPGAPEIANGMDDDCDTLVDEDLDTTDDDGDGYSETEGDCDDLDPDVHPGAAEIPDGVDEDCDGTTDEGTIAFDDDGDCFCEGGEGIEVCEDSTASECAGLLDIGDCDDADEDIHPDAAEDCDGEDHDCDGLIAGDDPDTDVDSDGHSYCDRDCEDDDGDIHPGAPEYCNDIDDDCDGVVDEDAVDADTWYRDWDGDDYGDASVSRESCDPLSGYVEDDTDCDDTNPDIWPGWHERCDEDDVDEDCDGLADDSDPSAGSKTYWYRDWDGDGYGVEDDFVMACDEPWGRTDVEGDCDDSRSDVYPGAAERCDDRDNDCDGSTDEAWATGCTIYYLDYDEDGYGTATSTCTCESGDMWRYTASNSDDCCGTDADAYPGASGYHEDETVCGGFDYNCDGFESRLHTTYGDCSMHISTDACYDDPDGWYEAIPSCGSTGNWLYDCRFDLGWGLPSCDERTEVRSQECR